MGAIKEPQAGDQTTDYDTIRAIVAAWPPSLRALLINDLTNTLLKEINETRPRRATLSEAIGLLDMGQPAPTDEEVELIIQEHREAKYG